MALTPFLGRSRNNSLWDPWDRSLFDPWIPISRMWDTLDFGALDTPAFSFSKDAHAVANTRVDWKETPESHIFTADMPGLKKEEVKIELQDKSTLRISGERHREEVKESDQWHRVERSSGSFMRQFRLPENVNVDDISAKLENGVLSVNVPKIETDSASNGNGNGSVKSIDIATDYK